MSYQFYNLWPYDYTTFPTMVDHLVPVNNEYFTGLHLEILAIEDELGLSPSADHDTVKDRLDYIEANLGIQNHDITGPYHTATGLTPGNVLAAQSTTGFNFCQLDHDYLGGKGTNTHAQIDSHIADTTNPHSTTKTQVGLSEVANVLQIKREAGEFGTFTELTSPATDDLFLTQDISDSNNLKKITAASLSKITDLTTKVRVALQANLAIVAGAWTQVNYSTSLIDTLGEWQNVGNKFVAAGPGYYLIEINTYWEVATDTSNYRTAILKNGAPGVGTYLGLSQISRPNNQGFSQHVTTLVYLNTNDEIRVYADHTNASNRTLAADSDNYNYNYIVITRV